MSDYPPAPPPPPSEPSALVPVGPWPRLGARIIDGLVLLIPNLLLVGLLTDDSGTTLTGGGGGVDSFVAGVVSTLLGFAYAVYLEASRGRTVGKQVLGIAVVGADGRNPTPEVAARRNAWLLLSLVPLVGGLASFVIAVMIAVSINRDPFKRGIHDNFAGGTAVIRRR